MHNKNYFLEKLANRILETHPSNLSKICVVFPSRRAGLFLKKHLSQKLNKAFFSPQIYSIEDFIFKLSDLTILDNISLLFELYEIHKTIAKNNTQNFEKFVKWGQILLNDFNEIDQHLSPVKPLFNYLIDFKNLFNWNPQQLEPTEFQKQYISFFQSLFIYYKNLNTNLSAKNNAYSGMAYRIVAENILKYIERFDWIDIIFAGFNALTKSEEKIIFELISNNKASAFWDIDRFYLENDQMNIQSEAGYFIKKYSKYYKNKTFDWISDDIQNTKKNIKIYGIPKQIGQAKLCGQIISENPEIINSREHSAIILNDENLLFPILNSIPESKELNVSMGIPVSSNPIFEFLKIIFDIHQNPIQPPGLNESDEMVFYVNHILKILKHPIISIIYEKNFAKNHLNHHKLIKHFEKSNRSTYSEKDLKKIFFDAKSDTPVFNLLFSNWRNNVNNTLENTQKIIQFLREAFIGDGKNLSSTTLIDLEHLYIFSKLITRITNYQLKYKSLTNNQSLFSLFSLLSKTEKLILYGEPLKGVQLMGMLETRALDFENIILCSVNENIIPKQGKESSFIPFDIRCAFNLPTYREKNAIYAYHFFRVLQRAKNIYLIYNTEADPINGGGKSRYLLQLQEEWTIYKNINIKEHLVSSQLEPKVPRKISITKTPLILDQLKFIAQRGFSPSSLNIYKKCTLQFYFREIVKLGEPITSCEFIDNIVLGNIIHNTLQKIFEPFIGYKVTKEKLEEKINKLFNILENSFHKIYKGGNIQTGKNFLIFKVAYQFIHNYLKHEINNIINGELIVVDSVEKKITVSLPTNKFQFPSDVKEIKFKGIIDRIDFLNTTFKIIDYKTSSISKSDLKIKDWNSLFDDPKTDKSFQLVFYAWLHYKNSSLLNNYKIGIYALKKLSEGFVELSLPNNEKFTENIFFEFEKSLIELVQNIFDNKFKFEQTKNILICNTCNYKNICIR